MTDYLLGILTGIVISMLNVLVYKKTSIENKAKRILQKNNMAEIIDTTEPLKDISNQI